MAADIVRHFSQHVPDCRSGMPHDPVISYSLQHDTYPAQSSSTDSRLVLRKRIGAVQFVLFCSEKLSALALGPIFNGTLRTRFFGHSALPPEFSSLPFFYFNIEQSTPVANPQLEFSRAGAVISCTYVRPKFNRQYYSRKIFHTSARISLLCCANPIAIARACPNEGCWKPPLRLADFTRSS
jgi:hypothetical protein